MPTVRHDRAQTTSPASSASTGANMPPVLTPATDRPALPATLKARYELVKQRVASAAKRARRNPESIITIAVTKYAAIEQVRELLELGHADFAENMVQNLVQRAAQIDEFVERHRQLGTRLSGTLPTQVRWHMIGHLQRNKVRKLIGLARLIHSVDSLRLAEEVQAGAARHEEMTEVLIQVNVANEKSKFGIAPAATRHLIDQMDTMLNVKVRGLMCMAPLTDNPEKSRQVFTRGLELFEEIKKSGAAGDRFDILSMGMSSDFEVAIECGANMIRVGSAIFGERAPGAPGENDSGDEREAPAE